LPQTLEDAHEQESLSAELMRAQPPRDKDSAQMLAAAWLARDAGEDPEEVVKQLRKALAPSRTLERPRSTTRKTVAPESLHAAFRDPQAIRGAILLGAALAPRRTRSRMRSAL
jgi:hypothetical protein